jgi:hypothetical protein
MPNTRLPEPVVAAAFRDYLATDLTMAELAPRYRARPSTLSQRVQQFASRSGHLDAYRAARRRRQSNAARESALPRGVPRPDYPRGRDLTGRQRLLVRLLADGPQSASDLQARLKPLGLGWPNVSSAIAYLTRRWRWGIIQRIDRPGRPHAWALPEEAG